MTEGEVVLHKQKERIRKRRMTNEDLVYYLILIPFMGTFFVFNILPVLSSATLSLFDYDMVSTPHFIGLENYIRMFTSDRLFMKVVGTTLRFSVIAGPLGYMLAFLLAWMINEFPRAIRVLLTFVFYVPSLVGNALYIWQVMFSGDSYAYVNNILLSFGFITEPIQWFQNTSYNFFVIVLVQLWMSMGISFLANISGLQNVNTELYEAGAIDGIRNRFQELIRITLPSMGPSMMFAAVMQISNSFSVGAICNALAGFPSTDYCASTIVTHIMDYGNNRYEMGYACSIATVLFCMMLLMDRLVKSLLRKFNDA